LPYFFDPAYLVIENQLIGADYAAVTMPIAEIPYAFYSLPVILSTFSLVTQNVIC
jgi:hypothetical protein